MRPSYKPRPSIVTSGSQKLPISADREATKDVVDSFLTRDSRNSFIARVYAILAVQLAVTAASIFIFGSNNNLRLSILANKSLIAALPGVSLLVSTVAWFICCISEDARRKSPLKWQMLVLFTLGEAISVGFISSFYKFRSVMSAMLATGLATAMVSIYTARQSNPKYDLSQWGSSISSCGLIFLAYGLEQVLELVGVLPKGFLPYNDMLYCLFGACLFSFYLAYHTKLIVAGKNAKYQMSEKDYVFGASKYDFVVVTVSLRAVGVAMLWRDLPLSTPWISPWKSRQ